MRCIMKRLTLLAAALLLVAVPVIADEGGMRMDRGMEQGQRNGKDECLLTAKNCSDEIGTVQDKIDRLTTEINRGTSVYTNDELNLLKKELEEELTDYKGGA